MLRRFLLASAGAVALAGAAAAAELPPAPPPPPPPPPPLWTGFYAGLSVGGAWSSNNSFQTASANISDLHDTVFAPALGFVGDDLGPVSAGSQSGFASGQNSGGVIGGGQIGYNFQFYNNFLIGIEADISGLNQRSAGIAFGSATDALGLNTANSVIVSATAVDWLGTVRGRLGWLITPTLLIYGDGGLAYGGVRAATNINAWDSPNTTTAGDIWGGGFGFLNETRVGWTAGGGLEWLFMPNWSLKVEYLYYDLGTVTWANAPNSLVNAGIDSLGTPAGTVLISNVSASRTRFDGNIVRLGLNYHFNWAPPPVVAKY
jgi:outer membrane immunogenic protein